MTSDETPEQSSDPPSEPLTFEQVLFKELEELKTVGKITERKKKAKDKDTGEHREIHEFHQAHASQLVGLAFSGGGIRSATFNLGVLQALAKLRLLSAFHYLSTVSGGGYIGSWLSAWIRREGLVEVEKRLTHEIDPVHKSKTDDESKPSPITYLRQFSNYLTPRPGVLSLDTWTAVAAYLTNLLLNLTVLALALASLLLVPRILAQLVVLANGPPKSLEPSMLWLALPLVLIALGGSASSLKSASVGGGPHGRKDTGGVFSSVVLPLVGAAFALALGGHALGAAAPYTKWGLVTAIAYTLCWITTWAFRPPASDERIELSSAEDDRSHRAQELMDEARRRRWEWGMAAAFPVGLGAGLALRWLTEALAPYSWVDVTILGPPLVVGLFGLMAVLHIGLVGALFEHTQRQWLNRVGAWLLIFAIGWLGAFSLVFYGPVVVKWLGLQAKGALSLGWLAATAVGVLAGRRPEDEPGSSRWVRAAASVAPFVFMLGLVVALSLATHELANGVQRVDQTQPIQRAGAGDSTLVDIAFRERAVSEAALERDPTLVLPLLLLLLGLGGGSFLLSTRVDINEFSMHNFYRNRLTRAYLGASRVGKRRPSPFTGFDPDDDLPLPDAAPQAQRPEGGNREPLSPGPIHILNTTINLTSDEDLGSQERKASSFFFTPFHFGFEPRAEPVAKTGPKKQARKRAPKKPDGTNEIYDPVALVAEEIKVADSRRGFRPTSQQGPTLGTALAISGAAVNPSMGYKSSSALAFLMTVFNTRLGWWLRNPSRPNGAAEGLTQGPVVGLFALLNELFGNTTARAKYVNLADGGFFDNLGIYELVRRRCRFILACDVEADPKYEFNALGNAIRRCRSDFGIDIDIQLDPIRKRAEDGFSRWHCAVGKIRYRNRDLDAPDGRLIYLKASLTGDEPEDLLNYSRLQPDFPHESTADQWFGESQFESYRMLGYHVADQVLRSAASDSTDVEALFGRLARVWYPPSTVDPRFPTLHSKKLDEIYETLRSEPELESLLTRKPSGKSDKPDAAKVEAEDRASFYLCRSMIQLMEDVYTDLELETEYGRPENRGWMNLFRGWARTTAIQRTWAGSAASHGARFQTFCERQFRLRLGTLWVEERAFGPNYRTKLDWVIKQAGTSARETRILTSVTLDPDAAAAADKSKHAPPMALCLLSMSVLTSEAAARERGRGHFGRRGKPPMGANSRPFPIGIALVTSDDTGERVAQTGETLPDRTLRLLRIRSPFRGQALGPLAIERLIVEHNVKRIALSEPFQRLLGRHATGSMWDLFRSVENDVTRRLNRLLTWTLWVETHEFGSDRSKVDPVVSGAAERGDTSPRENEILEESTIERATGSVVPQPSPQPLTLCLVRMSLLTSSAAARLGAKDSRVRRENPSHAERKMTATVGIALVTYPKKDPDTGMPADGTLKLLRIGGPFRGHDLGRTAIESLIVDRDVTTIDLLKSYREFIGKENAKAIKEKFEEEVREQLQRPPDPPHEDNGDDAAPRAEE